LCVCAVSYMDVLFEKEESLVVFCLEQGGSTIFVRIIL